MSSLLEKPMGTLGAERTLEIVGNKWAIRLIHALIGQKRRYSDLQRALPDVSQRMLTLTLRSLERDGLIERKVYPVVPPHTEYSLTALGDTIVEPLRGLCRWAEEHFPAVEECRRLYDVEKLAG